jgi:tRNA A37 N6-isopentenylltransferase MiaA
MRTRQFAKRQMTWFRRQLPVTWLNIKPDERMNEVAKHVERRSKASGESGSE